MRYRKSALVAVILIITFILCLPMFELIDHDDLVLTGQDIEISILDLLTIFCVWFTLAVRVLAFLPNSWAGMALAAKALTNFHVLLYDKWIGMLFLPDEFSSTRSPLPLLI